MRERASRVDGNIVIASSASGTCITLTVPARSAFQAGAH
jgi:signal transduction histidine kinase